MRSQLMPLLVVLLALAGCGSGSDPRTDQPLPAVYAVETVATGFDHPWGMAFLPDGQLLVTERSGRLSRVDLVTGARAQIRGLPELKVEGQGGLLDVILHPRFSHNRLIYFSFSAGGDDLSTHLGLARLEEDRLLDYRLLFRATPAGTGSQHFGGRLAFDHAGYLYLSLGDRHERARAQDLLDHNGSIIRLNADGSVPGDNPFVGRENALPEIFSYGHRNVQGLAVHPQTGRLWLSEHGPQGGDELNVAEAGKNYGWPLITYGEEYGGGKIGPTHQAGLEQPVRHWTPAVAPAGILFYEGAAFPAWKGNLFVATLAGQRLLRLQLDGERVVGQEDLLADHGHRIRDVEQGPDGFIYLLIDAGNAPILRLRPVQ